MVLLGTHLGGAGFSPDAVARHVGVLAAALGHHLLQHVGGALTGLLADNLTDHLRTGILNDGAVLGADGLNHIGFNQIPPVNDGGKGADHL